MKQKRFKKLLMAQGVCANTARGLVEYMKVARYCAEKGEEVFKLADTENVTFECVKIYPYAETYKRILEGRDFLFRIHYAVPAGVAGGAEKMIDRTSYEYKLLVRLYQLLERGKRLKDKEFILTVWPKLLSVTQLYIQYAKDAFTFSGMSECVFFRNHNFGLPLRFTNETIFDMCMLDEEE